MFTKRFWLDMVERVIATFAETFLAVTGIDQFSSDLHVSWQTAALVSGFAALAAVLKSLAALQVGVRNTASLAPRV